LFQAVSSFPVYPVVNILIPCGVIPNTKGCEECEKEKKPWVAIRQCLTCGHVGCCDSSVGRHATKHFEETSHPVMVAVQDHPWKWCYIHKEYY